MRGLQGTRQKSGRNFGIRPAPITWNVMGKQKQNTDSTKTKQNTKLPNTQTILRLCFGESCFVWVFGYCALICFPSSRFAWWGLQQKSAWRLFIKNTAPCELVRGCIGGDTWPMPEGQICAVRTSLCSARTADSRNQIHDSWRVKSFLDSWILNHDSAVARAEHSEVRADAYKPWWMSAITIIVNSLPAVRRKS